MGVLTLTVLNAMKKEKRKVALELRYQRLIIEVVRDMDGAAFKLSSRFLVGVPDLLIKLPGYEALLLEVKQGPMPVRLDKVALAVTPAQKKFLSDFAAAGMATGIASFVQKDNLVGFHIGHNTTVDKSDYRLAARREQRGLVRGVLLEYMEEPV